MTTTITYMFNGRDIQQRSKTISANSITALIDKALEYTDEIAHAPGRTIIYEVYNYAPAIKSIRYACRISMPSGCTIDLLFNITGSLSTLRKACKYFQKNNVVKVS